METLLWVAFLGALVIWAVMRHFTRDARIKRYLAQQPLYKVNTFPSAGPGRLQGRAIPFNKTISAPLSERPCVAWYVKIEEHSGGNRGSWRTVLELEENTTFFLDDGTGRALIDIGSVKMALDKDARFRSGTFDDATPQLEAFLNQYGRKSTGYFGFNKSMRYREGIIEPNEEVIASGIREPARDEADMVLASGEEPVHITDMVTEV